MKEKLVNLNIKSFFALLLVFIMMFSIISPTVSATEGSTQTEQEIEERVNELKETIAQQEKANGVSGEIINFSDMKKFDFNDRNMYGNLESDHYQIVKNNHNYNITLKNLTAKKIILPLDDADQGNTERPGSYSGKPRQTNITITLIGNNKITGYGLEGTCVKGVKIIGEGNLSIKALPEPKVEKVRNLNKATKYELEHPETIPVEVKLTSYIVPGIRIETGDDKNQSDPSKYAPYSDDNSLVFAGTGNITIDSPRYHGITNNGDIKFTSGNVKINSEKSAISAHRIIVGDEQNTEFSLELDSKERAFYDKPTFLGDNYIIMASKFSGESAIENASIKSKTDVQNSYTSYRYIKAFIVHDEEGPEFANVESNKVYCSLPTITVTDETAIDSITVNGTKVTQFTKNTDRVKTFAIPTSNQEQKEVIAKDVLGNESKITFTAHNNHKMEEPIKVNEVKPTCEKDGYHINEYYCSVCKKLVKSEKVIDKALGHSFGEWIASEGKEERSCTVCHYTEVKETVIDISNSQISLSKTNYSYDGKAKEPVVTVKNNKTTLVKDKDYSVKYNNNINSGIATVVVTGKSNYKGTLKATFTIEKVDNEITASNITKSFSNKEQSFSVGAKQKGNAQLSYSSDNSNVTVNSSGEVTIKAGYAGTATITIKAKATEAYNEATKKITVSTKRIDNEITASNITKSFSNKEQSFSVGAKQKGNAQLSYSSDNKNITVNSSGEVTIKAGYAGTATITIKAKATEAYNEATKKITVSTKRIDNEITASNITKSFSNKDQSFSVGAKQKGNAQLSYSSDNKNITVNSSGEVTIKAGYAGTATITIKAKATEAYNEATKKITVSTKRIDNEITASNITKSFSNKDQSFSVGAKQKGNAQLSYSSDNSNVTVNSSGKVTIKKGFVGKATITITANATEAYNEATNKITVSTKRIDNEITASNITKSFANKDQSFSVGAKQKGNAQLSYSSDNSNVTVNSSGKVTIKKGFVGKATITITANATSGYNKATQNITITVQKANNTITASNITKNYSLKKQSFLIGAKQVGDAKLTYSSDNKNITVDSSGKVTIKAGYAGTATITIKANATEKYNEVTKKITISTKKIDNKITASNFTKTYANKNQSFLIGAKQAGNAKLTYSSNNKDVTVNSSGKVTIKKGFIGKATITITANATSGYNKATKKITVTVNPPAIKISKISNSSSKTMKVTYAKNTVVTGYQIQYSTDKNFKKDVKTTTVKKNSTTSTTISKLTKGKTYYVRVRTYKTVSGTNFYSNWSPVKNVKISK